MRRLIALAALLATPAEAAERHWPIGSVERVRVEAPVAVRIVTGAGTGVRATGERAMLDTLDIRADGNTLTIRAPRAAALAGEVVVATPRVDTIALYAPATLRVDTMRGDTVAVSVAGAGAITVGRVDADSLAATLVGEGTITAAGHATTVRLTGNGPGTIDTARIAADRVTVQAQGDVIVRTAARSTAQVTAGPDAQVAVDGQPQCTIRAAKPANVRCGTR